MRAEVPLHDGTEDLIERLIIELVHTDEVEVPREPAAHPVPAGARQTARAEEQLKEARR